jgi:hypothetical protein
MVVSTPACLVFADYRLESKSQASSSAATFVILDAGRLLFLSAKVSDFLLARRPCLQNTLRLCTQRRKSWAEKKKRRKRRGKKQNKK